MAETIDISALNNALKVYGAPQQKLEFNNYSFLHQRLKRIGGQIALGGRTFEISLKTRGGGSWRTLNEMEALPAAGSPAYALATVQTRTAASVFRISLMAWRASKGRERAWVDGKIDAMNDCVAQFAQRVGQMWYRTGSAAVARINGAPTLTPGGGSFIVDDSMTAGSNFTQGVLHLMEEARLSFSANLTGLVAERTSNEVRITDIDEANLTVTFDGQGGDIADGDYVFFGDRLTTSKNRDMNGLLGIVDNGSILATLHGIDRTADGNAYWQANRLSSVGAADLENVFQRMSDEIARRNRGKISDIITTYGVRRRFVNNLKGDRRFNFSDGGGGNYKGGFKSLQWNDGNNDTVSIWVDKDCPKQTAFLLDWNTFALANLGQDADWLDEGEGILKWIDNTIGYQGVYFLMGNLVCTAPNRNAVLLGITED